MPSGDVQPPPRSVAFDNLVTQLLDDARCHIVREHERLLRTCLVNGETESTPSRQLSSEKPNLKDLEVEDVESGLDLPCAGASVAKLEVAARNDSRNGGGGASSTSAPSSAPATLSPIAAPKPTGVRFGFGSLLHHSEQARPSVFHEVTCSCGNIFLDDALFCRKCGIPRPNACSCGNILADDAVFCRKCGAKVGSNRLSEPRGQKADFDMGCSVSIISVPDDEHQHRPVAPTNLPGELQNEPSGERRRPTFLSAVPLEEELTSRNSRASECSDMSRLSSRSSGVEHYPSMDGTANDTRSSKTHFAVLDAWSAQVRATTVLTQAMSKNEIINRKAELADNAGEESEFIDASLHFRRPSLWKRLVVNPTKPWRVCWDMISCLLIVYECIVIPMQFIEMQPTTFSEVAGWIVRVFWSIDFPLCFLTGFAIRDGTHEMRPRAVAVNYLRTWAVLDFFMLLTDWAQVLISSLSFAAAARVGKTAKTLRLLRMIRVTRLFRLNKLPTIVETIVEEIIPTDLIPIIANMFKIVICFAWINHVIACLWFNLGKSQHGKDDWISAHGLANEEDDYVYLAAYHWSLQNFCGAAEIWPWNKTERTFAVIVSGMSFVAAGAFVSSLTSSMTHFEIVNSQDSKRLTQLKHWLLDSSISSAVSLRAERNARHALKDEKRNIPEASVDLLKIISAPLQREIHFDMHMPVLAWHPFFRLYNDFSLKVMSHVCHEAVGTKGLSKGDALFVEGEAPQEPCAYFIKKGSLRYTHLSGVQTVVEPGAWASEACIWTSWIHCGTMVALDESELLLLDAHKFQAVANQFQKELCYAQKYSREFVNELNQTNEIHITDLEDPEMDINWLAQLTCPIHSKQSGLIGMILGRASRRVSEFGPNTQRRATGVRKGSDTPIRDIRDSYDHEDSFQAGA